MWLLEFKLPWRNSGSQGTEASTAEEMQCQFQPAVTAVWKAMSLNSNIKDSKLSVLLMASKFSSSVLQPAPTDLQIGSCENYSLRQSVLHQSKEPASHQNSLPPVFPSSSQPSRLGWSLGRQGVLFMHIKAVDHLTSLVLAMNQHEWGRDHLVIDQAFTSQQVEDLGRICVHCQHLVISDQLQLFDQHSIQKFDTPCCLVF